MSHHSAHPAPETIAAPHPLDPLTGPEIAAARAILEDAGLLGETVRVPMLLPDEPTKTELAAWRPGAPIDRRVDVTLLDTATGVATEAIVSITRGEVLRSERVPNDAPPYGQPQYLFEEYERAEQIVKASPEWQAAMTRRGLAEHMGSPSAARSPPAIPVGQTRSGAASSAPSRS